MQLELTLVAPIGASLLGVDELGHFGVFIHPSCSSILLLLSHAHYLDSFAAQ